MRIPERYYKNNTVGTLTLLEVMLSAGVKRFVFSSTAALYGNPERIPIREEDKLAPTSPYGDSKFLVERILGWLHEIHGLRYASLRYFNAAGASERCGEVHDPETHLIPLLLQAAAGRRYPVEIVVRAMDRRGLLRDVTTVVAEEHIDIERLASQGDAGQGSADLSLRVSVAGLEDLNRLLARLAAMPGIISARRKA